MTKKRVNIPNRRALPTPEGLVQRAQAERRHLHARSGDSVLYHLLINGVLNQRERRNELPSLTPARAVELYEAWRRGEMAEVQLMWDEMEERDETLATVLNARLAALEEMPRSVVVDSDTVGDNAQLRQLAERQRAAVARALSAVENLPEALVHLGMADFRGVAALEITGDERRMRWEVIEPWNLCRPMRGGAWLYNENADPTPAHPEIMDPASVIIREARPIDIPAMFLIVAKCHAVNAWDSFLDVFGIPNIFLELPPATTDERAAEFDALMQRLIGAGVGTVPSGAKFQTVETTKDNTQSFETRAKWCDDAIITLAMGGLLTVATAPNSGTLAGNAHSDSFARLTAASARSISAAVTRQFVRRWLEERFPGEPALVKFELAPQPTDKKQENAQLLATLAAAGWRPTAETVSELMSFPVEAAPASEPGAPAPLFANREQGEEPPAVVANSAEVVPEEASPPLTEEELSALRDMSRLIPERLEQDAAVSAAALQGAVAPAAAKEKEPAAEEEEGQLANACNQYRHDADCTGATRAKNKGGRGSKGNPKAATTQSNTPLKAAPGATTGVKERLTEKLLEQRRGGKVGGIEITSQATNHLSPHLQQNVTARKISKALHQGKYEKDGQDLVSYRKGTKVVTSPAGKGKMKLKTAYSEMGHRLARRKKPGQEPGSTER